MRIVQLAAMLALASQFAGGQTAQGFIKIHDDRRELKYVRAARVPDLGNPSERVLLVVFSQLPLSAKTLFDYGLLLNKSDRDSNQMVNITFRDQGPPMSQGVSWTVHHKLLDSGFSSFSQSPNPYPFKLNSSGKIEGRVEYKTEPPFTDFNEPVEISVTYSTVLDTAPREPVLTPADASSALQTASAQAYLSFEDAIEKGDRSRFLAGVPAQSRGRVEKADFPKLLEFLRPDQTQQRKILKALEQDGESTLWISGVRDGKKCTGKAHLEAEGERWVVLTQNCE